jgi:transcriptional regulator with XRE-family HTH domain
LEQQQKIEIGQRVKWLRDNSAETSRSIARYVDVSVEAVRNWIAGKGISWESAEKVAQLYEIDVDWVWRGQGKSPQGYPVPEKGPTPDPFPADPYAERLDEIDRKLDEILKRLAPG